MGNNSARFSSHKQCPFHYDFKPRNQLTNYVSRNSTNHIPATHYLHLFMQMNDYASLPSSKLIKRNKSTRKKVSWTDQFYTSYKNTKNDKHSKIEIMMCKKTWQYCRAGLQENDNLRPLIFSITPVWSLSHVIFFMCLLHININKYTATKICRSNFYW